MTLTKLWMRVLLSSTTVAHTVHAECQSARNFESNEPYKNAKRTGPSLLYFSLPHSQTFDKIVVMYMYLHTLQNHCLTIGHQWGSQRSLSGCSFEQRIPTKIQMRLGPSLQLFGTHTILIEFAFLHLLLSCIYYVGQLRMYVTDGLDRTERKSEWWCPLWKETLPCLSVRNQAQWLINLPSGSMICRK